MKFIGSHFLVTRQYLRSTTRAKHPPTASSSRHRPGTQHSPLITGVFFIGTSERHRRATPQANEMVLRIDFRCL